jgi:hypothetical protein
MSTLEQIVQEITPVGQETKISHFQIPQKRLAELITLAKVGERMQWVPVGESLPECDGMFPTYVLALYWEEEVLVIKILSFHRGKWCKDGIVVSWQRHVTHWMPLPEPPKWAKL